MAPAEPRPASLRRRMAGTIATMFVLLAIQNLAGMWVNLYVTVTDTSGFSGVYPAMFRSTAGSVHTIVGVLIGLNAIAMLVNVWRAPDPRFRGLAALVLALVGVAAYLGYHFVVSGGDNAYSFAMELCFVVIVLCEAAFLFMLPRAEPSARSASAAPSF